MEEFMLLESASLRNKLCKDENTLVLEKIGQLTTLPETGWATTENVASFYQVPENTIRYVVKRNRKEVESDGYKVLSYSMLKKWHNVTFKISKRGLAIFPRRAVLRLGMLLRDSLVAKLVRSYLLNSEGNQVQRNRYRLNQMVDQLDQQAEQLIKNAGTAHNTCRIVEKSSCTATIPNSDDQSGCK